MNVGIIGWRGMVGSVLVRRMLEERDFDPSILFLLHVAGRRRGAAIGRPPRPSRSPRSRGLAASDVLISCQGGDYTSEIYPRLRQAGWAGYWIDAASTLRMADDAVICSIR